MADDYQMALHRMQTQTSIFVDDFSLKDYVLTEIERLLNSSIPSKSLSDFHLPLPSNIKGRFIQNRLLLEEKSYDRTTLHNEHAMMVTQLNPDQLTIYEKVRSAITSNQQILLFVYGHGGTGKTFLWSTIIAFFRSIGKIVLVVAGSGIASLLLPSGRTAHSRFNIPLHVSNSSMCNIKKGTHLAALLQETSIIIWDEATMTDRRCFECVDRSLRDILDRKDIPFGGISVLLGGDFRQTLPVKPKKSMAEIISATLPNSTLWPHFTLHTLRTNMRLSTSAPSTDTFALWLLEIGNGTVGFRLSEYTFAIEIPPTLLIHPSTNPLQDLINFVYTSDMLHNPTVAHLSNRAIVCPKNETAEQINRHVLQTTAGPPKIYYSIDSITSHTQRTCDPDILYPPEYLNQLNFSGIVTRFPNGENLKSRLRFTRHSSKHPDIAKMATNDTIQILAEKPDQDYIEQKLLISRCYQIEDYTCSETNEYQKSIADEFHINLGPASRITEILNTGAIPKYYFHFQPINYLQSFTDTNTEFPDFIGIVKDLKDLKKKNGDPFVLLTMTDINGDKIKITLWNECIGFPKTVYRAALTGAPKPTVAAITSLKVTGVGESRRIGSREATYVFVNPDIPETTELLTSYQRNTQFIIPKSHPLITLQELAAKYHSELRGKTFICKARIDDFETKAPWCNAPFPDCVKIKELEGAWGNFPKAGA
ncbi:hypothetical protein LXL04_005714 [Taraxacum kok-saghyz]